MIHNFFLLKCNDLAEKEATLFIKVSFLYGKEVNR